MCPLVLSIGQAGETGSEAMSSGGASLCSVRVLSGNCCLGCHSKMVSKVCSLMSTFAKSRRETDKTLEASSEQTHAASAFFSEKGARVGWSNGIAFRAARGTSVDNRFLA